LFHTSRRVFEMPAIDLAIPILLTRSVEQALAFYRGLGFDGRAFGQPAHYAVLTRGTVEFHLALKTGLDPTGSEAMCYIRVADAARLHAESSTAGLSTTGIPRLEPVADRPWQMREFALVDPDGNLLRIGQPLGNS